MNPPYKEEHLTELEGRRVVGGKVRHRKVSPICTFCALEFHSLTPATSLGSLWDDLPRTKERSELDWQNGQTGSSWGWLPRTDAASV